MMLPSPLRILLVEDSPADAELILHILRKLGTTLESLRVADAGAFDDAIRHFHPHVILSDFTMPGFNGHDALRVASEVAPRIPFVFVSNTIGEDVAIDALQSGAADYVLKDNLRRLPSAIERALRSAEERGVREYMTQALRESEERFRSIVESSQDWVWEMDAHGRLSYSNAAVEHILGYAPDAVEGTILSALLGTADSRDAAALSERFAAGHPWQGLLLRFRHSNGSHCLLESTGNPVYDAHGTLVGYRGINRDLTRYLAQENRIRHLGRLHAVLSALGNAVLRAGTRQGVLDAACRIAVEQGGFLAACIRESAGEGEGLRMVSREGSREALDAVAAISQRALAQGDSDHAPALRALRHGEATIISDLSTDTMLPPRAREDMLAAGVRAQAVLPVGKPVWSVFGLYADEPQAFDEEEIALFERLVDEIDFAVDFIAKSEKLEYLAYHNPISGLPNRAAFQAGLSERLRQSPLAVAIADIERFAAVNESRGRAFGDALLKQLGQRLRERVGSDGLVAHLEADAFGIAYRAAGNPEAEAERLRSVLHDVQQAPFLIGDQEVRIALSAGQALAPEHGDDPETIEHNAAAALMEGQRRKQRIYAFGEDLRGRAARRLRMEHELRAALEIGEFELYYQPKFNAANHALIGAEALLRWRHPVRGLVPPGEFIQVLEETALIVPVGHWVMGEALRTGLMWREQHPGFRIAVNVSAQELHHSGFLDACRALLQPHADQPLDIEVTESMLIDDLEHSMYLLDALRDLGCRVSIDDFGTGYSSLNYLARLPSDEIKIDQSFIAVITESPETLSLVTNIIGLAHSLSLKVVAEGVEDNEQAKLLRLLRCDVLQGYLLGKPMPADEFERNLLGQSHSGAGET